MIKEKQIEEMFDKLDTDKSNALDMTEMSELLNENGVKMTKKQVTEMFSACKRFFLKNTGIKGAGFTIDENLQLKLENFKLITTDPKALSTVRNHLLQFRREHKHAKVPVTIDQLFHRFLVNEKRKDFMKLFDKSSKELIEGNYNQFTNAKMMEIINNLMKSA